MAGRKVTSRIDAFAGLSDRDTPTSLTRIESPDLLNVDFSGRDMARRNGYTRVHTSSGMMRDSSARLDGKNDYIKIPDQTSFDFGSRGYIGIGVVLRSFPWSVSSGNISEVTILSRGSGAGASRMFQLSYDPTLNTFNGGWRIRARDGSDDQVATINDGDAGKRQINAYRFIEVFYSTGTTYTFKIFDGSGGTIGSTTITISSWLASTDDWRLGTDTTTSGFAHCTLCEFRLFNGAAKPSFQGAYGRELTDTEAATCVGYWKLNDGNGSTVTDSSGNNITGIIAAEGPEWVTDSSVVVGRSGLEFFGEGGTVHLLVDGGVSDRAFKAWDRSATPPALGTGTNSVRSWILTFIYTPRMGPGETTVRDQTLFWSGNVDADPSPLGVKVVSNDLKVFFRGSGSTTSAAFSVTGGLDDHVGKRIRVVVANYINTATADEYVIAYARVEGATASGGLYASTAMDTGNVSGSAGASFTPNLTDPSNVATSWSLGARVSDFAAIPVTERTSERAFGVISDFAFFRSLDGSVSNDLGGHSLILDDDQYLRQWSRQGSFSCDGINYYPGGASATTSGPLAYQLVAGVPLEDGYGNVLETLGETFDATLYPEEEDGVKWDLGLVDPYRAVEGQMLFGFDRIGPTGSSIRSLLAISGTTLYEIDTGAGTASPVAGNLHKGGKWSVTQYGQRIYMASKNGKRPRQWDGAFVDWVGIRAPFQVPIVTGKGSGGSLSDGTYYVKATYRNPTTGNESNPSPTGTVTLSGGGSSQAIDSIVIPTSTDPQVTQRRIWVSSDNSNFYLAATVEDNTTTTWGTDIGSVNTSAASLTTTGENEEPPASSIVKVFKDRLFVAGNPQSPTRVYWSKAGELNAFNQATEFVDADLDSGDPVTALETLRDSVVAHMRDGRVAITASGNSADPFYLNFLSRDTGAIGPLAVQEFESSHIYVGERDIVLWDGSSTFNASSPEDANRPSIQKFVRETIRPSRRQDISVALNRKRSQAWIALSTDANTRNDTVLIFDYSQGVWSKYLMDMDVVAEIEDENDDPTLYGISWGYVCKLDTGDFDGHGLAFTVAAGTATGAGQSSTELQDTDHGGSSWTTNVFKGMYCVWYDVSTGTQYRALIASNDANKLTFYDTQSAAPADGDPYGIGAVEFWAEFNLNFGNPFSNVRLKWAEARGSSDSSSNIFRVAAEPDVVAASMPFSDSSLANSESSWATTETYKRLPIGGIGRNWRVRVGDTGLDSRTGSAFPPSIYGRIRINELLISGVELNAP